MSISYFEIRVCASCGLRYPLIEGNSFGARCPHCLGETRSVLKREIDGQVSRKESQEQAAGQKMFAVLLDNIRSAWNVGSIFRSADGFGFEHIYLCGITPAPDLDAVRKTALGADKYVSWSHHKDAVELVQSLQKEGRDILALEENEHSRPIDQVAHPTGNSVLILGNEVTGVDPELLDLADSVVHIPMFGKKHSFNVANAFSVAAYALVQQKR